MDMLLGEVGALLFFLPCLAGLEAVRRLTEGVTGLEHDLCLLYLGAFSISCVLLYVMLGLIMPLVVLGVLAALLVGMWLIDALM